MKDSPEFKNVSSGKGKLKYLGFCSKCDKVTFHRFTSGSLFKTTYTCIKCKTKNISKTI